MQNDDNSDPKSAESGGRRTRTQPPGSEAARTTEERKARLARALRDNLARRKQQARARRAGDADETEGLPAAKKDESTS